MCKWSLFAEKLTKIMNDNIETNFKILVVDDSQEALNITKLKLEKKGYQIYTLTSAASCMDFIAREKIDLVILDIMMPEIDGNQALRMIRSEYNQIELPIIMMTVRCEAEDVVQAFKGGANDYITKPVQYEIAYRKIKTHLLVAEQSKALGKTKALQAFHSTIATYNHELNNPLTICLGKLTVLKRKFGTSPEIDSMSMSLLRMVEILKKMEALFRNDS